MKRGSGVEVLEKGRHLGRQLETRAERCGEVLRHGDKLAIVIFWSMQARMGEDSERCPLKLFLWIEVKF